MVFLSSDVRRVTEAFIEYTFLKGLGVFPQGEALLLKMVVGHFKELK